VRGEGNRTQCRFLRRGGVEGEADKRGVESAIGRAGEGKMYQHREGHGGTHAMLLKKPYTRSRREKRERKTWGYSRYFLSEKNVPFRGKRKRGGRSYHCDRQSEKR